MQLKGGDRDRDYIQARASSTHAPTSTVLHRLHMIAPDVVPALLGLARTQSMLRPGGSVQVTASLRDLEDLLRPLDLGAIGPEVTHFARRRQLTYIAGRVCAELALTERGCDAPHIARGARGEPVWPAGWCGSIAHCAEIAVGMAARSRDCALLGVDVEPFADEAATGAITSVCLTDAEAHQVLGSRDPRKLATILFCAKEAYYKAIHQRIGRFVDFREVHVWDLDWRGLSFIVDGVEGGVQRELRPMPGSFSIVGGILTTWVWTMS